MAANQIQNLVGRRFGRLTVIESVELVYKRGTGVKSLNMLCGVG